MALDRLAVKFFSSQGLPDIVEHRLLKSVRTNIFFRVSLNVTYGLLTGRNIDLLRLRCAFLEHGSHLALRH